MFVRNKTGVRQSCSTHQVSLPPDVWLEVPYAAAMHLWERRLVDIRHGKISDYSTDYLYWLSPFSMGDGYATAAENMVHALIGQGQELHISQCWFVVLDGLDPTTIEMLDREPLEPALVGICMATPGEFHKLPTPCKLGITMYESDDPLATHPEWRNQCNEVDMLIVPSEYCREVFGKFVDRPIEVASLAVNPLYYIGETFERPERDTFTFAIHGTLSGRKAPLELIAAFKKAFPTQSSVRLVLKTRNEMCGYREHQLPDLNDARISIISEDYYPQQMLQFLQDADAYVYPSKGEGYGLPPREAMATGLPTIFANNTGMSTLANPEVNWPIPTKSMEDSPLGGQWRLCDLDSLIDAMRWVFYNQSEARARGKAGAQWFVESYGAAAAAKELLTVVDSFSPQRALKLQKKRAPTAAETISSGAAAKNKIFFDIVSKSLRTVAGVVLDIGVSGGEGVAYRELVRRGHHVLGIVQPGTGREVRKKLLSGGVKRPFLRELALPKLDVLRHKYEVAGCVCHSTLQNYTSMAELSRILSGMFSLSQNTHISVPTVRYPGPFCAGALLYRPEYWKDVLAGFAADFRLYGTDGRYIRVQLLEQISAGTGRRRGRIIDGTWRAAR